MSGDPLARDDLVQLDLPRRRPAPGQHPCLRHDGQQRPRLPSPQDRRWRHGQHLHRQLRARLGHRPPLRGSLMAKRIDYYDDPAAPKANSMVPSVNVVVTNDQGQILLIRRTDNENWAVPGGAIDLGESMVQAAVRETKEESGVDCQITGLVGIYTDPKHVILYTSNGEARQEFSILLTAQPVGGQPTPSDETSEVRWVDRADVTDYTMDRSMQLRVRDYLEFSGQPRLQ